MIVYLLKMAGNKIKLFFSDCDQEWRHPTMGPRRVFVELGGRDDVGPHQRPLDQREADQGSG